MIIQNNEKYGQDLIRSSPQPNCYLCGSLGDTIYSNIKDKIFNAPGQWTLKICTNSDCRLSWLDPMPLKEDISRAYLNYFTHQTSAIERRKNHILAEVLRWNIKLMVSILKRITWINLERKRLDCMYLHSAKPGKLLEVGCGAGRLLAKLQGWGWQVEGQEVDSKAAENAHKLYSFPVHLGALENLSFPENSFDAIIMNHVIEHVHDPIALLTECYRILQPNGILTITTPNNYSYGHRYFKSCWSGIDPPRHLYIFSSNSLRLTAIKSGFNKHRSWTTSARTQPIAAVSFEIKHKNSYQIDRYPELSNDIRAMLFQIWARIMQIVKPNSGEECVLIAEK